jgi:hypothetical protein
MRKYIAIIITIISLSSCSNKEEDVKNMIEEFTAALNEGDTIQAYNIYPDLKEMHNSTKHPSDLDISILNVDEKNGRYTVHCKKGYYDNNSSYVDDDCYFWVEQKDGELKISKSRGLINIPKGSIEFSKKIGAIKDKYFDKEYSEKIPELALYYCCMCDVANVNLSRLLTRKHWSWQPSYGSVYCKGTILNNLGMTLTDVDFVVTFYNGDNVIGKKTGVACHDLAPGSTSSFSAYSSDVNGYEVTKAVLSFKFSQDIIKMYIANQDYEGDEFEKFESLYK